MSFYHLYHIVLGSLTTTQKKKIQIFGRNSNACAQCYGVLEDIIGEENIPENYGGSLPRLTDKDPPFAEYLYQRKTVLPLFP